MSIGAIIAIYFIVWWVTLFAVLPWGVRSQAENKAVTPGTEPGAPARPQLLNKMVATSFVAAMVTGGIVYLITSGVVSLDDIPLPFDMKLD